MKKAWLAPVVGAMMLIGGTTAAVAQDVACGDTIASYLKEVGVDFTKMSNVSVTAQRWAHKGDDNGPIYGYSFSGTPAQCSSGGIHMGLTTGCEINHAVTTPGCSIKGIPSAWW
jgi:hypothetical protein